MVEVDVSVGFLVSVLFVEQGVDDDRQTGVENVEEFVEVDVVENYS